MNLAQLYGAEWPSVDVSELSEHTGEVDVGCAFFAVAHAREDAIRHAELAFEQGARLVVSQHALNLPDCFQFPDLARQRGALAARFYGEPARQMECVGVTGTNGKTSVAYYVANLSDLLEVPCGYIGTLGWGRVGGLVDPNMTTPNPVALQRRLADLLEQGCQRVAIEVSSHALEQRRAHEVPFVAAVFTNLTRDHLDYHGSMAAYGAAKLKLFTEFPIRGAVLSLSDPFSEEIASHTKAEVIRYGRSGRDALQPESECQSWYWDRTGDQLTWSAAGHEFTASVAAVADFTLDNITAAMAVLSQLQHTIEDLSAVVGELSSVPGRMQVVAHKSPHGTVVVDYAHTPDALSKALQALRQGCPGQLICVVGCGGDRDRGKRPQMAAAASSLADRVWLTSDNPRTESPEQIIADMRTGIDPGDNIIEENVDRREAIRAALLNATLEDVVLIAGKGHEDYQEVGTRKYPFDDAAVARTLLGEM